MLFIVIPLIGWLVNTDAVATFFSSLFSWVKFTATIATMIAIVIAVYSFIAISELNAKQNKDLGLKMDWNGEKKQKNDRWVQIEKYMTSPNSSDWKIAILEADNMLDDILERVGYTGKTLGERLKGVTPSDLPYLDELWYAHKLRNAIAHKGTIYEITQSDADQAIDTYYRSFKALGYLE